MITLVRGSAASRPSSSSADIALRLALPFPIEPWGAFRALLGALHAKLGGDAVADALAPHAALLAPSLSGLTPSLSRDDRAQRDAHGGLGQSTRPNVAARIRPIIDAWAGALAPLLAGRHVELLVAEVDDIDVPSLTALRGLLRATRASSSASTQLDVVIGRDPTRAPDGPFQALSRRLRLAQLRMLEALPDTRVVDAPRDSAPLPSTPLVRHPHDHALEARAAAALHASAPDAMPLAFDALLTSFDALACDAAVYFGLALEGAALDPARRCTVDRLLALAWHELDPIARADAWAAEGMARHFGAALAAETDPLQRAHLGYRLCMLHARGRGDAATALAYADAAVRDADASTSEAAPLFGAWARNGRAYTRLRAGFADGAASDLEDALARLPAARGVPSTDVGVTHVVVANNRARVAQATGDADGLQVWRARTQALVGALAMEEQPSFRWFTPPEDERDLEATRAHQEAAVAHAREALDPEAEAVSSHALALAYFRLGNAAAARRHFTTSLRIFQILDSYAEDIVTERLNAAVSAYRAGLVDAAESEFAALRREPLFADDAPQAEAVGALAMIGARRGDRAAVAARSAEAIDLGEKSGDLASFVRVLRSVGEAALTLGDLAYARNVLTRARNVIAEIEEHEGEGSAAAEDVLGVIVSALDAGVVDAALVTRGVEIAPYALGDANAWWDLPRLLAHVRPDLGVDPDALAASRAAAEQRVDAPARRARA